MSAQNKTILCVSSCFLLLSAFDKDCMKGDKPSQNSKNAVRSNL